MKPSELPSTSATDAVRTDQVSLGVDSPDVGIPESLATAAEALMVTTWSRTEAGAGSRTLVDQSGYQDERWRRIKVHQDEDVWIQQMKKVLIGDVSDLPRNQVKKIAKISDQFVLDSREVLYRLSTPTPERPRNKQSELRLVVPEALRTDMLHYSHEDFQGDHQGINRPFERLRSVFYWVGMYADVQKFVRECIDCASAKGRPPVLGPSPGNIEPRYPFEVVSMDFVTELPEHDQDPRFMSKVFARFRDFLKSKQRATLGYRPQANGQQERSVQTVMRSVRAYVAQVDQSDWDEHAERVMFALNTSFDAARLDTPFYLVHDAQGTISAPKPSTVQERTALAWRRKLQRDYSYALACVEDLQKKAKRARSAAQTRKWRELSDRVNAGFEAGDFVWLYIPKVRTGLSRKIAHLWHGPFQIEENHDDFRVKLKIPGTRYRVK
ncbi:LOW QUALITY PROTEIN: reverse transcriptase, partial [Phytophthora megakarya]